VREVCSRTCGFLFIVGDVENFAKLLLLTQASKPYGEHERPMSPVDSFTHTIQRIPNRSSSLQNSKHSAGNFWEDSEKGTLRGNKRIVKKSFDKYLKIWLDRTRTTEREAVSRDTKSQFLLSRTNISGSQARGRRNHLHR